MSGGIRILYYSGRLGRCEKIMIMEYYIVGGYIKISKAAFTMEMLSKDSVLRALLNWKSAREFGTLHPGISEPDQDNNITIRFDTDSAVHVEEHPKALFERLKAKLGDRVSGKVACRYEYSLFGGIYTFEVDLDATDDVPSEV